MDPESNLMEHAPQPASILLSIIGNRITGLLQPWGGAWGRVCSSSGRIAIDLFRQRAHRVVALTVYA